MKPRLLDLFCGVGGAATGYHRAGFEVVGVDKRPQKHYPFEFHQADALEYLAAHGHEFPAIHASPPCQEYSITKNAHPDEVYPDLLPDTIQALEKLPILWQVENVPRAPMRCDLILCGTMFGLRVQRHRWFMANWQLPWWNLPRCHHVNLLDMYSSGPNRKGTERQYCDEMGVTWAPVRLGNRRYAATEAIPPAYTEFIGRQLMRVLAARDASNPAYSPSSNP